MIGYISNAVAVYEGAVGAWECGIEELGERGEG